MCSEKLVCNIVLFLTFNNSNVSNDVIVNYCTKISRVF